MAKPAFGVADLAFGVAESAFLYFELPALNRLAAAVIKK